MLSAAISTIALAMVIGPQLQLNLQAVIEESQPAVEVTVTEEADAASTDVVDEAPAVSIPEIEPETAGERVQDPTETETRPIVDDTIPASEVEPASSEPEAPAAQTNQVAEADWPVILDQVSDALSSARTAQGNFVQTNADGSITTGTFALNRPGRMRFDYDDPTPILIVSNGTTVAMEDSELETVDRVPIGATPLGLILSTDLRFDDDVDVLSVMRNEERVGVRVSDATGELEGTLTMIFDAASYDLLGWLTMDGNLQTTVVDLLDVETNVRIDPRLFRLDDAEDEEEER